MPHDRPLSLSRILPSVVFDQLGIVLSQTVEAVADQPWVLTEAVLPVAQRPIGRVERFVVVVSPFFSGLLLAETPPGQALPIQQQEIYEPLSSDPSRHWVRYQVGLTFAPAAIAAFLQDLSGHLDTEIAVHAIDQAIQRLQPNDPTLQSDFTLRLTEVLAAALTVALPSPDGSCDLAVAAALQQQVEQERLLNQVTSQIRQSMELPEILQTTVEQVRQMLQVDRVVIYQLQAPDTVNSGSDSISRITYEARANDTLPSLLNVVAEEHCFSKGTDYRKRYQKGYTLAIADTQARYALSPCLQKMLQEAQVRAKLVVPIIVQDNLWGLLIAHQCAAPRRWQAHEQAFMQRIGEHLAIALYQASLYTELQQQKQTLAEKVKLRTQELYDALTAAQSANLAKAEFLAMMSHELRTPLTCIIGMANTLIRLPPGAAGERFLSAERQREYYKTIQNSGEHLLELINDILDLSQVEAGKLVLDIQPISLSQLVAETVQMLKDRAIQREITLELDLQLDTQPAEFVRPSADTIAADSRRLKQILLNLLSNAIKFTPPNGRVTLRVWREHEDVVFQVQDTGIGISPAQQALLFNKFQQLDMSRQRQYNGTGLGLALTKQLVELHQGRIAVESIVDVGSTFTVWLPSQALHSSKKLPSSQVSRVQPAATRLLLIDNNEEAANLICNLLTAAGYQIVWLMNPAVIDRQIQILQPRALLISTQLVGMGAPEVLSRLRTNRLTQTTPILILTSDGDDTNWQEIGATAVLPIPIQQPERLLDAIASLLNRDRSPPSANRSAIAPAVPQAQKPEE